MVDGIQALKAFSFVALVASSASGWAAAEKTFAFDVWLDDRSIGEHTVDVEENGTQVSVRTEARFDVKLLFVNVFKYRHEAEEVWNGDCVASFESRTRSNGKRYEVAAQTLSAAVDAVPVVRLMRAAGTDRAETELQTCLGTYAYWDLARLDRAELMNTQTGSFDPAELISLGRAPLPRQPGRMAQKYVLRTEDAEIGLWYGDDGAWLALQTETQGRMLTYLNKALDTELRTAALRTPDAG